MGSQGSMTKSRQSPPLDLHTFFLAMLLLHGSCHKIPRVEMSLVYSDTHLNNVAKPTMKLSLVIGQSSAARAFPIPQLHVYKVHMERAGNALAAEDWLIIGDSFLASLVMWVLDEHPDTPKLISTSEHETAGYFFP